MNIVMRSPACNVSVPSDDCARGANGSVFEAINMPASLRPYTALVMWFPTWYSSRTSLQDNEAGQIGKTFVAIAQRCRVNAILESGKGGLPRQRSRLSRMATIEQAYIRCLRPVMLARAWDALPQLQVGIFGVNLADGVGGRAGGLILVSESYDSFPLPDILVLPTMHELARKH